MDISKIYINMCDCPEIQDGWRTASIKYPIHLGLHWIDSPSNKHERIWLPHQDQIQEMILNATVDFDTSIARITLLCNFSYFCGARNEDAEGRSNVSIRKESLEVLWLAFYMYKIHKKCWGGEEWEEWDKWENSQDYEYGFGLNEQRWNG